MKAAKLSDVTHLECEGSFSVRVQDSHRTGLLRRQRHDAIELNTHQDQDEQCHKRHCGAEATDDWLNNAVPLVKCLRHSSNTTARAGLKRNTLKMIVATKTMS